MRRIALLSDPDMTGRIDGNPARSKIQFDRLCLVGCGGWVDGELVVVAAAYPNSVLCINGDAKRCLKAFDCYAPSFRVMEVARSFDALQKA